MSSADDDSDPAALTRGLGAKARRDIAALVVRMTSEKKIEANRRNAKKSTGPRTPRGKALARFNALRSGLYARSSLLPQEDEDAYRELVRDLCAEYSPQGSVEVALLEQIVGGIWRLQRLDRAERAFLKRIRDTQQVKRVYALSERELGELGEAGAREIAETVLARARRQHSESHVSDVVPPDAGHQADVFGKVGYTDEVIDGALLEALSPPQEQSPLDRLFRQRRSLTRELIRNVAALKAVQGTRLTFYPKDTRP